MLVGPWYLLALGDKRPFTRSEWSSLSVPVTTRGRVCGWVSNMPPIRQYSVTPK